MAGILLLVTFAGCSDQLATYSASGTVTLANGAPLTGATVSLESVEGSHSATGRTDDNGHFALSTFESGDGIPLGNYRAIVMPPVGGDPDIPQPVLFNPRYSAFDTSGLQFSIEGATQDLTIQLD